MIIDKNNLDRLKAIIGLKNRCLYWSGFRMHSSQRTFFSDFNDETNIPLIYILNDEFTNISGRDGIGEIIRKCTEENKYLDYMELKNSNYDSELISNEIKDIYVWGADSQIYKVMTRFIIYAFSIFEYWTCKAYDEIKSKNISKNSKLKKLETQLKKYIIANENKDMDLLEKIKNEIFIKTNSYVSSREKVDFIISKINFVNLKEKTKLNKAKELVSFLFSFRNTIHNVMINKSGEDYILNTNGAKTALFNDFPPMFENYSEFIHSLHLLIDLYCDLYMHLNDTYPNSFEITNEF